MNDLSERSVDVGGIDLVVLEGGDGKPLLMLHDELGFPGWMTWNEALAPSRRFVIPLQPGFGRTDRVPWCRNYRDLAAFYARFLRESGLGAIDVIGFSAGGFVAAEMAAACPGQFDHMVLVAPMGVRPTEGQILDFLAITMRSHMAATLSDHEAPEASKIYGGEISPRQFELFEAARAETSRLGWEPFMFEPSLPNRLGGVGDLKTLIVWGDDDLVVPRGCIDAYQQALPAASVQIINGVGHRPEVEDPKSFAKVVTDFLGN